MDIALNFTSDMGVTIDQTSPDSFLDCMRSVVPGAACHISTAVAVNNLLPCTLSHRSAVIIGHGNDGSIVTGTGRFPCKTKEQCLSLGGYYFWKSIVSALNSNQRLESLRIFACHPGADQAGANFLFLLSKTIYAPVAGPTGYVYCLNGRVWLEAGASWQVAYPDMTQPPNPIPAPTRHFELFSQLVLPNMSLIPVDSITGASFDLFTSSDPLHFTVAAEATKGLVKSIAFFQPFTIEGSLAAITTGKIVMTFDEFPARTYEILNDRLVRDLESKTTYYKCYPSFVSVLRGILFSV
jgi:hypothetical protein